MRYVDKVGRGEPEVTDNVGLFAILQEVDCQLGEG